MVRRLSFFDMTRHKTWHDDVYFGLHFDLHPMVSDTALGADTTYAHIRRELEKVKPDFVQYDCKGHGGYAGYPTQVGVPSPGIVRNALTVWRRVTRDMGLPLSVHYSGTWDGVQWERHPDWARRRPDGKRYGDPNGPEMMPGFAPQSMAADSPYDDELLIPQLIEVIDLHDIDGVWVDGECWAAAPDWSETTRRMFTQETGVTAIPLQPSDPHWADYMAFNRRRFEVHLARYVDALHARKPGFAVCSNWAYTVRMPDEVSAPVNYLSGDFVWAFGLDSAELEAKFMDSRGMPWDLMAWGFTTAGPMNKARWTAKPAEHLKLEGALVAANGGAFWIYDQPLRSGKLVDWHMDTFAEVANFLRARQAICQGTSSASHVALLHSQSHFYANNHPEGTPSLYNEGQPVRTLTGALQLLLDNHYHTDVMNEDALLRRMYDYPVIVIAEQTHLPQALKDALLVWVKQGGKLLLTGSNIVQDFPDVLGVITAGDPSFEALFVPADGGTAPVDGPWQLVKLKGARALASLHRTPDASKRSAIGHPAATIRQAGRGAIAAVYGALATTYADYRYPRIRSFAGHVLRELTGAMPVEIEAPAHVHGVVRNKPGQQIVHLFNMGSANPLSPVAPIIESITPTGPITCRMQSTKRPQRVTLAPNDAALTWTWSKGVLTVTMDTLHIHAAIVVVHAENRSAKL